MPAFNEEQFRKEARAAGYLEDEINAAIAKQTGSVLNPSQTNIGPSENQQMLQDVRQRLPENAQTFRDDAEKYLYGAAGLAALGGGYGLYELYQKHQDRALERRIKELEIFKTERELGLRPPAQAAAPVAAPVAPSQPPAPVAPVNRSTRAAERIAAGQAAGLGPAPVVAAEVPVAPVAAVEVPKVPVAPAPPARMVLNPNPTSDWDTYIPETMVKAADAPKTAVALETNQPGSKVAEAVVKDELVKPTGAVEPPARTGSGQPAFPGTGPERARMPKGGSFASPAEIPASLAFVPGAQYFDSLANAARSRTAAQDIVRAKGGYPTSDAQAREWAGEFLKSAGAPTREAMLAAGTKPETVKGVFKPVGAAKSKGATMAGVAGALLAASDLALASSEEGRAAMQRAESAIKDIGISPNIFLGKGEELGRLGTGYITAGNPSYLRELNQQLAVEKDAARRAILIEEIQKAGGGVPPRVR